MGKEEQGATQGVEGQQVRHEIEPRSVVARFRPSIFH